MPSGPMQMSVSRFEFDKLVYLLGRSEHDPEVRNFLGESMSNIERDEYYGSLEFKPEGVDVVFNEAPWVVSSEQIIDPKELYLCAFHLHSDGHEGYAAYAGQLPNGVDLGDSEAELLRKMGQPSTAGGGIMSSVTIDPIPRWLRYSFRGVFLHFQLDREGRIEMATLSARDIK